MAETAEAGTRPNVFRQICFWLWYIPLSAAAGWRVNINVSYMSASVRLGM